VVGGSFAHPRYQRPGPPPVGRRLFGALNHLLPPARLDAVLAPEVAGELAGAVEEELAAAVRAVGAGRDPEVAFRLLMAERVGRMAAPGLALDRHYLPVVTPYTQGPVIAQMLRLAGSDRRFSRLLRATLTHSSPTLARIPWQRTGAPPRAPWPWHVALRAARGMMVRAGWRRSPALADYQTWLDGPLAQLRSELIDSLAGQPLFDEQRLRARAATPPPGEAALDGILMTLGIALDLLGSPAALPGEIDRDPAPGD